MFDTFPSVPELPAPYWAVVIGTALIAAITDVRTRRVPNFLTGPVLFTGWAAAAWMAGWAGFIDAFLASILLALPYVLLFMYAGGGAGDAKLMGALGAWLGLANGVVVLFAVVLAGAVLAIGFAIAKKRHRTLLGNLLRMVHPLLRVASFAVGRRSVKGTMSLLPKIEDMQTMPYGIAVLAGVCVAVGGLIAWNA